MGVRRLTTFLENHCPEACFEVNIVDLANQFRSTHQREPVLIVDGSGLFRKLYRNLDWVCGGQYKQYEDAVTKFIDHILDARIEPIFFFDGTIQESKKATWFNRRFSCVEKAHNTLDALKAGSQVDENNFVLPVGVGSVMHYISRRKCQVRRTIKECDEEIIDYATEHNCFAILAQDSDFAICKGGAKFYFSAEKLNFDNMTTLSYNNEALARCLKLKVHELPVLASLMGNDYIPANSLKQFHYRLMGKGPHQEYTAVLVTKIAEFIRIFLSKNKNILNMKKLSCEVFHSQHHANDLKKSIESYADGRYRQSKTLSSSSIIDNGSINCWDKILSFAKDKYIDMTHPSYIYKILLHLPYEMSICVEDIRTGILPTTSLKCMRQRMYGVLLGESPTKSLIVDEWCVTSINEESNGPSSVSGIPPPEGSPSLSYLWFSESVSSETKFQLLAWIASEHLVSSSINLSILPSEILAPACILSYLYQDTELISDCEVRVFAAVAVDVQEMTSKELSSLRVEKVDVRGVQLASTFARAVNIVSVANAICGYPVEDKWMQYSNIFDGKLFQYELIMAKNEKGGTEIKPLRGSRKHFTVLCDTVLKLSDTVLKKKRKCN